MFKYYFSVFLVLLSNVCNANDRCETRKDCQSHYTCFYHQCVYEKIYGEEIEKVADRIKIMPFCSPIGTESLQIIVPQNIRGFEDSVLYLNIWDVSAVRNGNKINLPDASSKMGTLVFGFNNKAKKNETSEMYEHFNKNTTTQTIISSYGNSDFVAGKIEIMRDSQRESVEFKVPYVEFHQMCDTPTSPQ
jgi:hypothetical protein